ncbi:MAG: translation elongation factor 4 [bacterium]|nr:translation elongation factor 4 [bacterium]
MEINHIRNFCIIAHVDHGKSTLADRLLEYTGAISQREMRDQVLDAMDLERERGITIKSHPVRLKYRAKDGVEYQLNLLDTPGHVDFSYEVSRSLAACEGALLIVDAAQGVEAQTVANAYLALDNNLTIIPVINKIDLPNADISTAAHEIVDLLSVKESEIILASAKEGIGTQEILETIVHLIPPPNGNNEKPLAALIFDSKYDTYRGVVVYIRVMDGEIHPGDKIRMMWNNSIHEVTEVGIFNPKMEPVASLSVGEVGYLLATIKTIADVRVGDTITNAVQGRQEPLPGYKQVKPMVYCGLYPAIAEDYESLRDALAKLKLNDASFVYEPDNSPALGFGYRCGFLGLLHMEIIQERLEREYELTLVTTAPNVLYQIVKVDGELVEVNNPSEFPTGQIMECREPYIKAIISTPTEYLGNLMDLAVSRRGEHKEMKFADSSRATVIFELPLAEVILDFYDKLKSLSRGYASLDYEIIGYRASELVKLDILLNGESVDALSIVVHRANAYHRGKAVVEKLRKLVPRQMFEVAIQAAIGNRVIARETVKALRKNVIAKCYGGDITRKRKLLEKQKEGKKRMKQIGKVQVPQEAFMAVLRLEEE